MGRDDTAVQRDARTEDLKLSFAPRPRRVHRFHGQVVRRPSRQ